MISENYSIACLKELVREDVVWKGGTSEDFIDLITSKVSIPHIKEVLEIFQGVGGINFLEIVREYLEDPDLFSSSWFYQPSPEREVLKVLLGFSCLSLEERWRYFGAVIKRGGGLFSLLRLPNFASPKEKSQIVGLPANLKITNREGTPRQIAKEILRKLQEMEENSSDIFPRRGIFQNLFRYLFEESRFLSDSIERALFFELWEEEQVSLEERVSTILWLTHTKDLGELMEILFPLPRETSPQKRRAEDPGTPDKKYCRALEEKKELF